MGCLIHCLFILWLIPLCLGYDRILDFDSGDCDTYEFYDMTQYQSYLLSWNGSPFNFWCNVAFYGENDENVATDYQVCFKILAWRFDGCDVKVSFFDGLLTDEAETYDCDRPFPDKWCTKNKSYGRIRIDADQWSNSKLEIKVTVTARGHLSFYERYKQFFTDILPNNNTLLKLWEKHLQDWTGINVKRAASMHPIPPFNCNLTHPHPGQMAQSVHNLHPGDFRIVAAMGDSLTAGKGILTSNVDGDLKEYRGHSFSGMTSQATLLIEKMKNDDHVRWLDDWKLITLFVGGNDLCDSCNDLNEYSATNYGIRIREALDLLHKEVPKAFVNLINIFDIAPIASMQGGFMCDIIHSLVCPCGEDAANGPALQALTKAYQFELETLVSSGRYDTRDDFTVVLQLFFKHTEPPKLAHDNDEIDMSYFSPDCFHFNAKGHFAAALSLWNNMMEPPAYKQTHWHLNEPFKCPGTHDQVTHNYVSTYKN